MDLYSMIKRESFFELFFPTVKKYFKEVLNEEIEIGFAESTRECNCVIKPKLSVVSSVHPTNRAKSFFYSEWNIRNSFLKNLAAKLYVWLMTNSGKVFAEYRIIFRPESAFSNDYIIAPNNRTIRVFDYQKSVVGCICKEGFTDKFMKAQIKFRTEHDYDFVLKLLDYGDRWFTEPIMKGHPLARVTDESLFRKGLYEATECIRVVAKESLLYCSSYDYCKELTKRIDEYLVQAVHNKGIETENEIQIIIKKAIELIYTSPDIQIPLSDSHGDLQTGNIWMDEDQKIWIYDWETADVRSIWYDLLVLKFSLRRANGWAEMLKNLTSNDIANYIIEKEIPLPVIKGVVMLEDLIFYFEDMLELPDTWGNKIFDAFVLRTVESIRK